MTTKCECGNPASICAACHAVTEAELGRYRHRAWSAEAELETRHGLRREINAALGIPENAMGDDALRAGLEAIAKIKTDLADMTADRDSWRDQAMERLKDWDEMRHERDEALAALSNAKHDTRHERSERR